MNKIGIYGGTFDPIHHAHLILARDALEQLQLDRVIFVPAGVSPHKLGAQQTSAALRLEMLAAALSGEPRFMIDECELRRPGPSFAIETIEEISRAHPAAELYYFIGGDNLPRLHTWHRIEVLSELVRFVVLERGEASTKSQFPIITRRIDVSATEIRNRIASGLSVRYLVPPAVEEIIQRHHFYKEPAR